MGGYPVERTKSEWLERLSDEQYHILREKGTEPPNSGAYVLFFEKGTYSCGGCSKELFESEHKFRSLCGWPSFDEALEGRIEYVQDRSFGMLRIEVRCSNCGSHLGHVFDDGPTPSGDRYCVNSISIAFNPKNK